MNGKSMEAIFGVGRRRVIAAGLMLSAFVFTGSILGHNLTMSGTLSPVTGTVITETETVLSGTFASSGCGLGADISLDVSDGTWSGLTASCVDAVWSWSATWSGYSDGLQTVTAEFRTTHGNVDSPFVHEGSVSATYLVEFPSCDAPDAPAIANAYLRSLGVTDRSDINTIIPQVAHAMNDGEFGPNPCAPGYAEAVEAFVQSLLDELAN